MEQALDDLDEGLRRTLGNSLVWREKDDLLRTVPDVGGQAFFTLLAYPPELGALACRQVAAPVDVAPFNLDSSTLHSKLTVWGGHVRVSAAPYMGALATSPLNPITRDFYRRSRPPVSPRSQLSQPGGAKLLVILNSMRKYRSPWRAERAGASALVGHSS